LCTNHKVLEGAILRTLENGRGQVERRRRAVAEVRELLARVYRGFVAWGSLYGDAEVEEELERRERVSRLIGELTNGYAPRSLWLAEGTRKKIENFIGKSDDLRSRFCVDVDENGYEKVRSAIARRVSKDLRSLKKEVEICLDDELAGPRQSRWRRKILRG
jgi:hypothetical protein